MYSNTFNSYFNVSSQTCSIKVNESADIFLKFQKWDTCASRSSRGQKWVSRRHGVSDRCERMNVNVAAYFFGCFYIIKKSGEAALPQFLVPKHTVCWLCERCLTQDPSWRSLEDLPRLPLIDLFSSFHTFQEGCDLWASTYDPNYLTAQHSLTNLAVTDASVLDGPIHHHFIF